MNDTVKLVLYGGLIICAAIFGFCFYINYGNFMKESAARETPMGSPLEMAAAAKRARTHAGATNRPTGSQRPGATNRVSQAATNLPVATGPNVPPETGSNLPPEVISNAAPENVAARSPATNSGTTKFSSLIIFGAAFFVTVLALGFLVGHDFSHFMGEKFGKLLFNEEGETIDKSAYEAAEEVWANGRPLEAIQMMREYLKQNPREQHVALRIAEIYEKDLHNPLAAALELEEVLKQKLAPEQWGWTAIHLCNLYANKLSQSPKAIALLHRIDREYGATAAAEKARKRLEMLEEEQAASPTPEAAPEPAAPAPPPTPATPPAAPRPDNADLQAQFEKFHQAIPSVNRPRDRA